MVTFHSYPIVKNKFGEHTMTTTWTVEFLSGPALTESCLGGTHFVGWDINILNIHVCKYNSLRTINNSYLYIELISELIHVQHVEMAGRATENWKTLR